MNDAQCLPHYFKRISQYRSYTNLQLFFYGNYRRVVNFVYDCGTLDLPLPLHSRIIEHWDVYHSIQ